MKKVKCTCCGNRELEKIEIASFAVQGEGFVKLHKLIEINEEFHQKNSYYRNNNIDTYNNFYGMKCLNCKHIMLFQK